MPLIGATRTGPSRRRASHEPNVLADAARETGPEGWAERGARAWSAWALVAAGLLLLDVALVAYTSYADRRIFSRWSPAHFALIVLVSIGIVLSVYRCL